jgi:hypothetical protein
MGPGKPSQFGKHPVNGQPPVVERVLAASFASELLQERYCRRIQNLSGLSHNGPISFVCHQLSLYALDSCQVLHPSPIE